MSDNPNDSGQDMTRRHPIYLFAFDGERSGAEESADGIDNRSGLGRIDCKADVLLRSGGRSWST
jgi:hypothetical protein